MDKLLTGLVKERNLELGGLKGKARLAEED